MPVNGQQTSDRLSSATSYQHAQLPSSSFDQQSRRFLPPLYHHTRTSSGARSISDDRRFQECNDDDDDESIPGEWSEIDSAKEALLERAQNFSITYDIDRGCRGTELKFCSFARPHMRAFHASWICFFTSFFVQFSQAPLLPAMQKSLLLTKSDLWWTNLWMMVGGIPMRFVLGPLCDKYGARSTMTYLLAAIAVPSALTGVVAVNLPTLTVIRMLLGAMDTFVPGQYWITCQFVREVGGTAMALAGGLGATGSGVTQLVTGSVFFPLMLRYFHGNDDLAWRWSLVVPAVLAAVVSCYFYRYSDDCPLGNFVEVKKAGLMLERSAVDSFRSGACNLNAWILLLQYAGSCGVDFTMCNGAAMYFHAQFGQTIAASGAYAFLYGLSAVFARGVGGWISDKASDKFSLRGRLWVQLVCIVMQGLLNIWFARTTRLDHSVVIMVVFSILVQMSMGTCYGIVPYVDGPNTGSIAGIVGGGGNVGAALLARMFMTVDYAKAMEYMGWFTIFTSLFTPFIVIRGYRGILFGTDDAEGSASRKQHSPLLVPGKVTHSPHLVSVQRRQLQR